MTSPLLMSFCAARAHRRLGSPVGGSCFEVTSHATHETAATAVPEKNTAIHLTGEPAFGKQWPKPERQPAKLS